MKTGLRSRFQECASNCPNKPTMNKAFQQGDLDSLCGVYALLNAYRLLVPRISKATFHRLFTESVVWLNGQGVLLDAVTDGLEAEHLLGMIQHTFRPVFPFIEVERLWAKKEQAEPELLNLLVKKYVASPNSTVLVCFENQAYGHWTVFQKADEKRVYLYDSIGRSFVRWPLNFNQPRKGVYYAPENLFVFHRRE